MTVESGSNPAVGQRDCKLMSSFVEERRPGDSAVPLIFRLFGGLPAAFDPSSTSWFDDDEAEVFDDLGGVGYGC